MSQELIMGDYGNPEKPKEIDPNKSAERCNKIGGQINI